MANNELIEPTNVRLTSDLVVIKQVNNNEILFHDFHI